MKQVGQMVVVERHGGGSVREQFLGHKGNISVLEIKAEPLIELVDFVIHRLQKFEEVRSGF